MKAGITGATCVAVVMGASMAVFAQTTERPASPTPSQPPAAEAQQQPPAATPAPEQSVTLVGCVQREAEYRQAHSAGRGGVAGTGAGVGNEFVLINASTATPGAPPAEPSTVGTAGSAGAYELTGPGEGQLEQYVGRRVEITGKMKSGQTSDKPAVTATVPDSTTGRPGAPGAATGSAAGRPAGQPSGGVDLTGQDLKLREFEVVSVREATGSCGPAK